MLSLMEELLLLALEDDKGTVPSSVQTALPYGLAAAGLSDLLLAGRLTTAEKQKVSVVDGTATGDDLLDEMLAKISQSRKQKSLKDWVSSFGGGGIKKSQQRLEDRLIAKGILRLEEGRFLSIFPWHHYPTIDGGPEAEARESLHGVLLGGAIPEPRTAILVSLVAACNLVDKLVTKEERKLAKQRAKEIGKGEYAGQAVSKAVEEVAAATAAMIAAVAAASVTSSSSSS